MFIKKNNNKMKWCPSPCPLNLLFDFKFKKTVYVLLMNFDGIVDRKIVHSINKSIKLKVFAMYVNLSHENIQTLSYPTVHKETEYKVFFQNKRK